MGSRNRGLVRGVGIGDGIGRRHWETALETDIGRRHWETALGVGTGSRNWREEIEEVGATASLEYFRAKCFGHSHSDA